MPILITQSAQRYSQRIRFRHTRLLWNRLRPLNFKTHRRPIAFPTLELPKPPAPAGTTVAWPAEITVIS